MDLTATCTGTVTDSHHGGWSAARLRWAGFDGLVFKGRADKPVYVYVEDGEVTLEDASAVWGKGVHDTVKFFEDKYGADDLSVIAIGPAGENLVRFACLVNEMDRASGRGGTGAVAGSKNLKAVVLNAYVGAIERQPPARMAFPFKAATTRWIVDSSPANVTMVRPIRSAPMGIGSPASTVAVQPSPTRVPASVSLAPRSVR